MASPRIKFDPEQYISLRPPVNGLTTRYAPHEIPVGFASELQNFLTHYNDKVCLRGRLGTAVNATPFSNESAISGIWEHDNAILIGSTNNSASTYVQPWVSAWQIGSSAAVLRHGGTGITSVSYSDTNSQTTSATATADENTSIGPRYTRLKSFVYGPAYGATAAAVDVSGSSNFRLTNKLLIWQGTNAGGGALLPFVLSNGPIFCMDAVAHYERVFVAAGCDPGAAPGPTTYFPNSLYYSAIDGVEPTTGTLTDTVARWQDQNGNINKILVGTHDDPIIALGLVNGNMVIFKRKSVWQLYGSSPSNFVVKKVTDRFGCVDPQSVCQINDQITFMSDKGLIMFDGSRFTDLTSNIWEGSGGIGTILRNNGFITRALFMSNCKVFNIGNDHLALVIETVNAGASATLKDTTSLFCGLCYIPKISWTNFSSGVFTTGTQGFHWVTSKYSFSGFKHFIGSGFGYPIDQLFTPETQTAAGDGASNLPYVSKYGSPIISPSTVFKQKLSQVVLDHYVRSSASVSPGAISLQDSLRGSGAIFKTFQAPTIADSQNLYVPPGDNGVTPWTTTPFGFINPGATIGRNTAALAPTPSGTNNMQITTTAALSAEGAGVQLSGTFLSGVQYTFTVNMRGNAGGEGVDLFMFSSGTISDNSFSSKVLTTTYTSYSVTWTPSANRSDGGIVIRSSAAQALIWFVDVDTIRVSKTASTHLLERWTNDVYSEIGPEGFSMGLVINSPNLLQYEYYGSTIKYESTRTMRPSTTS